MNDIQATLLLSQMKKINYSINTRLNIQKQYNAELLNKYQDHSGVIYQFYSTKLKMARNELLKILIIKKYTRLHLNQYICIVYLSKIKTLMSQILNGRNLFLYLSCNGSNRYRICDILV